MQEQPQVQQVARIEMTPEVKQEIEYKGKKVYHSFLIAAVAFILMLIVGGGMYEIRAVGKKPVSSNEDELTKYVKVMHSRGKTKKEIKEALLSAGWDSEVVEKLMK